MPARDGTGPWGRGPMTGRRRGYCATGMPGQGPGGFGRGRRFWPPYGFSKGAGAGVGWRGAGRRAGGSFAAPAPQENLEEMRETARQLEKELQLLHSRIDERQKEE